MIWLQRSLAKSFDLALFAGAFHLVFQFFGVSLLIQGMLLLILPILFAPLEALLFKCFNTTLGKAFFGFSYDRPFTLLSALNLSFKHAILILPLFLPAINLFFIFLYIRELTRFQNNRWDELSKEKLGKYSKGKILRTCVISFTLLFSTATFAPSFSLNQISNLTGIDIFIEGVNTGFKNGNISNWKKIEESELRATLYFPSKPLQKFEEYPVPKTDMTLELKHYIYEDAAHHYTLTYTTLPKSWTKWGPSLVLGVGINYVVDKKAIVYKKKCKHYDFPALEYKLKKNGKTTTGMLVLVEDRMYKIEFEQPTELAELDTEAEQNLLHAFFSSFKPHKA